MQNRIQIHVPESLYHILANNKKDDRKTLDLFDKAEARKKIITYYSAEKEKAVDDDPTAREARKLIPGSKFLSKQVKNDLEKIVAKRKVGSTKQENAELKELNKLFEQIDEASEKLKNINGDVVVEVMVSSKDNESNEIRLSAIDMPVKFDDAFMAALLTPFKRAANLPSFVIQGIQLSDQHFEVIANALTTPKPLANTLTSLGLVNCGLDNTCNRHFKFLDNNKALANLDLSNNNLSNGSIRAIACHLALSKSEKEIISTHKNRQFMNTRVYNPATHDKLVGTNETLKLRNIHLHGNSDIDPGYASIIPSAPARKSINDGVRHEKMWSYVPFNQSDETMRTANDLSSKAKKKPLSIIPQLAGTAIGLLTTAGLISGGVIAASTITAGSFTAAVIGGAIIAGGPIAWGVAAGVLLLGAAAGFVWSGVYLQYKKSQAMQALHGKRNNAGSSAKQSTNQSTRNILEADKKIKTNKDGEARFSRSSSVDSAAGVGPTLIPSSAEERSVVSESPSDTGSSSSFDNGAGVGKWRGPKATWSDEDRDTLSQSSDTASPAPEKL